MHFAPLAYRTALRRLVHRYKYGGRICAAAWFAGFIHDILQRYDIMPTRSFDIVTAVPMHPTKRRLRGHDHAERLASEFAALQGLPFSRLLTKVGERGSQTAKGRSHRLRDATSAYHAKETVSVSGKRVILIDDVHTSGATANACAHALRKAGATDVMLITIAKGTD
jgi:predicted amidophosphoribosyltransferase